MARSCVCAMTEPPRRAIPSRTGLVSRPRSIRWAIAIRSGWRSIPSPGDLWNNENGPYGGDEINIIKPGQNYGWPLVSFGRDYSGPQIVSFREGMVGPIVFWAPSIAPSGMAFYTGDKFPDWKNNVLVGAMLGGAVQGVGHLERIVFNEKWDETSRQSLLTDMKQRIRDVRQGPDGLVYVLTDEENGALIRLEPGQ